MLAKMRDNVWMLQRCIKRRQSRKQRTEGGKRRSQSARGFCQHDVRATRHWRAFCSIQYYLRFWLGICRTSLAVSALRIMRYCQ